MTYDEFKRHLGKAGLTVQEFATLVRMHPSAVTNCAQSGRVSRWMAIAAALMGEMAEHGVDFRAVLRRADIQPGAPRGPGGRAFGRVVTPSSRNATEDTDHAED